MCIRDRDRLAAGGAGIKGREGRFIRDRQRQRLGRPVHQAVHILDESGMGGPVSVSYTHLDVYKRQVLWEGVMPITGFFMVFGFLHVLCE